MLREMRLLLALRRLPGKWLTPTQNSAGDRRRFPDPPQRVRYSNQVFGDLDRRRFFGRLSPAGILAYATIISPSTWRFGTRGAIRDAKCPASRDRARSNQSLPSPTGVWLDCFENDWVIRKNVLSHCMAGRRVALVPSEFHGREFRPA
jgi:hypothetical protein